MPFAILGVSMHPLQEKDLHTLVRLAVDQSQQTIIAYQNLHGVYTYHRHEAMRQLHAKAYVHIDGMPLVFWGRLMGYPLRREHRVTWVDWMPQLMQQATQAHWRVFYLGAKPEAAQQGAEKLRQLHPGLQIETRHGHFDQTPGSQDNQAVIEQINAWQPHVLLVGMGMPRQETWVLAHADQLKVPAILTCGAAIEYFAGSMATPPRWMGRLGLEWLHRLASNPRRLWRRYLVEPWALGGLAMRDVSRRLAGRPMDKRSAE